MYVSVGSTSDGRVGSVAAPAAGAECFSSGTARELDSAPMALGESPGSEVVTITLFSASSGGALIMKLRRKVWHGNFSVRVVYVGGGCSELFSRGSQVQAPGKVKAEVCKVCTVHATGSLSGRIEAEYEYVGVSVSP